MKLTSAPATFERHELLLADEVGTSRIHILEVILFGNKNGQFSLFNYYRWPVSWDSPKEMNAAIQYLKQEYPNVTFPI